MTLPYASTGQLTIAHTRVCEHCNSLTLCQVVTTRYSC